MIGIKLHYKKGCLFFLQFWLSLPIIARDTICNKSHHATFKSQFFQVKDEFQNPQRKRLSMAYEFEYFGYCWWLDKTRGIHFMWGHGGLFAFIVPSRRLLVVFTSIPNTQGDYQVHADEAMEVADRIVAACY